MSTESSVQLKRPFGVLLLAFVFMLAPIGNIVFSFKGSGLENWSEPFIFWSLLKTMSFIDWVWLSMLFISGVLLLIQHKLAWVLSMTSLVFVLAVNAARFWFGETTSIDPQYFKMFSILSLLSTAGVLTIAYYFRYPYLDRRAKWTSHEQNSDRREYQRPEKSDRRKVD